MDRGRRSAPAGRAAAAMGRMAHAAPADRLGPAPGLRVAARRAGPQGPGPLVGCSAGGVLAACADHGCTDDHDCCGDVPRRARSHRPCAGGAPADHACVFAAHRRGADPRLRPGRVPPELRRGHRAGGVVLVHRLRALRGRVCTDAVPATGGRQARVKVTT